MLTLLLFTASNGYDQSLIDIAFSAYKAAEAAIAQPERNIAEQLTELVKGLKCIAASDLTLAARQLVNEGKDLDRTTPLAMPLERRLFAIYTMNRLMFKVPDLYSEKDGLTFSTKDCPLYPWKWNKKNDALEFVGSFHWYVITRIDPVGEITLFQNLYGRRN